MCALCLILPRKSNNEMFTLTRRNGCRVNYEVRALLTLTKLMY